MAVEVLRTLGVASLVEVGLRATRLPRVARWCGVRLDLTSAQVVDPPSITLPARIKRQLRAVDHVMRHWPFGDTCLRRCLVVGHLLRESRPVLRIGVALEPDGAFTAHSWLEVGGHVLDGDAGSFAAFGDAR